MDAAVNHGLDARLIPTGPRKQRSATTNGRRAFVIGGDGRGAWVRRWKDLVELHSIDLGGADRASEAQLSLIRRASALTVQIEQMEAKMSEGDDRLDLDLYNRCAGNLRRILETLGIERKPRLISDSLDDIVGRVEARRQAAE